MFPSRLLLLTTNMNSALPSTRFAFVHVKAFGDITVTAAAMRILPPDAVARCSLLIGPHLTDLVRALAPDCAIETLHLEELGLPPIFDLKKRGLAAGLSSAFSLRKALRVAAPGSVLVMPRPAFREQFIAGRRPVVALPAADNVYRAHERFLRTRLNFEAIQKRMPVVRTSDRRIAVCPFSRVPAKNVPVALLGDMAAACVRAGFEPEALLLEGEHTLTLPAGLAIRIVPRRFDALANALAAYEGVISADSLPAHLAEYHGTPAFVASPVPNAYWLPPRVFEGQHWGLFNRLQELTERLRRFLETLHP